MKTTIAFINGYSRSGKSSVLDALRVLGYPVVSTSQTLDMLAIPVIQLKIKMDTDRLTRLLRTKSSDFDYAIQQAFGVNSRDLKIAIAENMIVPTIGRLEGIVRPTVNRIEFGKSPLVFFETIGGDEYQMALDCMPDNVIIKEVNMVSDAQLSSVDIRKPFINPDVTINFNSSIYYSNNYEARCAYRQGIVNTLTSLDF
jgi:hypothetical protein